MKPPTVAVGHHKTDSMWNFYQQNFKKFQKLFHTAQTRIGRILATVVRSSMGRGWIYAFWMCWNSIPLDTLGAQCCGKWSMPDGRMCERNRWEGRYFLTIGKWPTIINVRMLCGIKLLKQGDYGVGCAGGVCVCVGMCRICGCVRIPRKRMENKWLWQDMTIVQVQQRVYEFIIGYYMRFCLCCERIPSNMM